MTVLQYNSGRDSFSSLPVPSHKENRGETGFLCPICEQKNDNVSAYTAFISQGKTKHPRSAWTGERALGTHTVLLALEWPSQYWQKYSDGTPQTHWDPSTWQSGSKLHSLPSPYQGTEVSPIGSIYLNMAGSRRLQYELQFGTGGCYRLAIWPLEGWME